MRFASPLRLIALVLLLGLAGGPGLLSAHLVQDGEPVDDGSEPWQALADQLVAAKKPKDRDKHFAPLEAEAKENPVAAQILAKALNVRWDRAMDKLVAAKLEKKFARLLGQREKLDGARKNALSLIEDPNRYFYPYRQPDVPADKAAQYPKVQAEVSKRIRTLEKVWEKSAKVKLSKSHLAALEDARWLQSKKRLAYKPLEAPKALPEWVLLLPIDVPQINLTNLALNSSEAFRLERDRKVAAYNERIWQACKEPKRTKTEADKKTQAEFPSESEREQVRVTNQYRNMLGRPSLTWDPKLQAAAHNHSEYQSRTGEFGHYQKDPATRTPFQRMKLAGYNHGVSENCAKGSSDPAAVLANWMRSSGHHRNMIKADHTQMASAISGDIWTQNYGTGGGAEGEL